MIREAIELNVEGLPVPQSSSEAGTVEIPAA
jgi:hypothetical protein